MIKTIVFLTKLIVATIASLLFASCAFNGKQEQGNGDMKTETRNVPTNFTKIEANSAILVTVAPGGAVAVTVDADSNLLPMVKTHVENGTLYINAEGSYSTEDPVSVHVTLPKIDALYSKGSATINVEKKIVTEQLTLGADGAGNMTLEAEADNLRVDATSGASVILNGKALKLEATASSGSVVNAEKLMANDIIAESSSGGNTSVSPILSLDAKASSGGVVRYIREPRTKSVSESSGGAVTR